MKKSIKKIMVFGVFDGLHDGHRHFLDGALSFGKVVAVLAKNRVVIELKGHEPVNSFTKRASMIRGEYPNIKIIAGDATLGSWQIIKKEKPDMIVLGYDQKYLAKELKTFISKSKLKIAVKNIKSYKPKVYHSSILNKLAPRA